MDGNTRLMMDIVVVDANLIYSSPLLDTEEWETLAQMPYVDVVVPEVVAREVVNNYRKQLGKAEKDLRRVKVGGNVAADVRRVADKMRAESDSFDSTFRGRAGVLGFVIVPPPEIDVLDIVERAMHGRSPYGKGDKDGFRDAVIWTTVLEVAANRPSDRVWLASNNHTDFGSSGSQDCPAPFADDLAAELEAAALVGRVHLVQNLGGITQHLQSLYRPLDDALFLMRRESLDKQATVTLLREELEGASVEVVSPVQAVTITATINTVGEPAGDLVLDSGAMAGEGEWSAHLTVPIAVTLSEWITPEARFGESPHVVDVQAVVRASVDGLPRGVVIVGVREHPTDLFIRPVEVRHIERTPEWITTPEWIKATRPAPQSLNGALAAAFGPTAMSDQLVKALREAADGKLGQDAVARAQSSIVPPNLDTILAALAPRAMSDQVMKALREAADGKLGQDAVARAQSSFAPRTAWPATNETT